MTTLPDPDVQGRVVVVAAGFALWRGGRCIAAARWADLKLLRAYRPADGSSDAIRIGVELVDGTVMELHEAAPGFDLFLDRAALVLPGMKSFASWSPGLMAGPAGGAGEIIFEKKELGKRKN
ncbi:MAG: hypothetical protein M3Z05_04955 [Gemmatimonadota bacterium]|nr:hypothetical protein [Gemmatimonadota bacterium]